MSNPSHIEHAGSNASPADHESGHVEKSGLSSWLAHLFSSHSHGHADAIRDPGLATRRGILALKVSLAALLVTALFQVAIVAASGSVALLADTRREWGTGRAAS